MDDMSDDSGHPRGAHQDNDIDAAANGWIRWFCTLEGHEYMVEVDEEYIRDPFNLYGLQALMPSLTKEKLKQLLKMILAS